MKICVVTLFPEMITDFLGYGIPRIAAASGMLDVTCVNPRDYTKDRHRTVDDRPYGGGPGMVMKVEPLRAALVEGRKWTGPSKTVYLSPQGKPYEQAQARRLAGLESIVLIAGRYEGVDERLIATEVDEEISIGDYVLSGGEPAAMVVIDSIARLLPGVLGSSESAAQDSFDNDGLLDCQHYTRPEELDGIRVPDVLLGGDHAKIRTWRRQQALERTLHRRPDLLANAVLTETDRRWIAETKEKASLDTSESDE